MSRWNGSDPGRPPEPDDGVLWERPRLVIVIPREQDGQPYARVLGCASADDVAELARDLTGRRLSVEVFTAVRALYLDLHDRGLT